MESLSPKILDGKLLAKKVELFLAAEVKARSETVGRVPGLGVILVGDNPASHTYVANKEAYAKRIGFKTTDIRLSSTAEEREVREAIQHLNQSADVDGILLQLPLPKHLDPHLFLSLIDPKKDADCLHPYNQGLVMRGEGSLRPCTPQGAMWLVSLALYEGPFTEKEGDFRALSPGDLTGMKAVVIGRSILVGKPLALLLLERNATVTMAHSKTKDLASVAREADILVAAVGVPELIRGDWIKNGAIVIDVGINRISSDKLVGDVKFSEAIERASAITPVPGGVGPMTVSMLMLNTLNCFKNRVEE